MSRSTTKKTLSEAQLAALWARRVANRNFSPGVRGVGTIAVFGKSGDEPKTYPIISLAALETVSPEESWAVRQAETIVVAQQQQHRGIFAVKPGDPGASVRVERFDPENLNYMVVNQITGG